MHSVASSMVKCTRYNTIWQSLSVTCDRPVVFSGYSGFSTNKTVRHEKTEILFKVALSIITVATITTTINTKLYEKVNILPKCEKNPSLRVDDWVHKTTLTPLMKYSTKPVECAVVYMLGGIDRFDLGFYDLNFESCSGEVYSIQHYVIKFVSDLRHVGGFLWVLLFPPTIDWPPRYNWNIVGSGVKHLNPNHTPSLLSANRS